MHSSLPKAEPWPEADALFHSNPTWLGADVASSVRLDKEVTLWLFGDTFLGRTRKDAEMVSNSLAVQRKDEPSAASMDFIWQESEEGAGAIFELEGFDGWLWPMSGMLLEQSLIVFLMKARSTRPDLSRLDAWRAEGSLGFFETAGTCAALIQNPLDDPRSWKPAYFDLGSQADSFIGTTLTIHNEHLYAFGWAGRGPSRHATLARWPNNRLPMELQRMSWWSGSSWEQSPAPVLQSVATEFGVTEREAGYVHVQIPPVKTYVEVRRSHSLESGWGSPKRFEIPEASIDNIYYTCRSHPHLSTRDALAVTYCSIGWTYESTVADQSLYYPRFLKIPV